MDRIDLHIHSNASDGTCTPTEVVEMAKNIGLRAVALTDHDSTSGIAEAKAAGERLGVEVVGGIEVSSNYRDNNVHILGYFIDPDEPALLEIVDWVQFARDVRNEKVVALLQKDGFDISMEELCEKYPGAVIGRPHMAEILMQKGYISSVKEGFEKFFAVGQKYYLPKGRISIQRAVEVIRKAGGVSVLAHPFVYHYSEDEIIQMIETAKDCGIQAMECYYSENTPEQQEWLLKKAKEYSLGVSGGSDYHGTRKTHITMGTGMGDLCVPYPVLEGLKALKK